MSILDRFKGWFGHKVVIADGMELKFRHYGHPLVPEVKLATLMRIVRWLDDSYTNDPAVYFSDPSIQLSPWFISWLCITALQTWGDVRVTFPSGWEQQIPDPEPTPEPEPPEPQKMLQAPPDDLVAELELSAEASMVQTAAILAEGLIYYFDDSMPMGGAERRTAKQHLLTLAENLLKANDAAKQTGS